VLRRRRRQEALHIWAGKVFRRLKRGQRRDRGEFGELAVGFLFFLKNITGFLLGPRKSRKTETTTSAAG
jgi:hypothetical protein